MHRFLPRPSAATAAALLAACALAGPARALTPPQSAAALPQGVERVASVEGVTEYRLPNGLRVLLFPDASKPTITVNITYLVGSRNESYGETGMAHLLEHLMFKGSPGHTNVPNELTAHGARPNGTTSYDRTNYFETFAATDENFEWALSLEADRMVNSFIAKKDLDSEMTVVRNEFESGENSPQNVLQERAMETAYVWHNYGNPTIGARADIENVPIERLQAFYKKYYQPDNAVLTVAGKFDEAKALALVGKYFAPIPRPARAIEKTYTAEPTQDGEREVTLRRVGDVQALCSIYHVPAGSHPDFAAVALLTQVLGDGDTGRLHKALVETKLASSAYGWPYQLREPGVLTFGVEVPKEKSLDAARAALVATVEGAATSPPTKEEVESARTQLLKWIDLSLNDSNRVGLELSEWVAMGDWRLFFWNRDQLRKATAEDVARVAKTYLKPSNRTIGLFVPTATPDRAEIPAAPDVAALLKDYKGGAALAAGEAFDPSPANVDARTTRATAASLKLGLLPKSTRGDRVNASLSLRFGDAKSLANRGTVGALTGQMLMRGTAKHTRKQIAEEFDRLKAAAFVYGGPTGAGASIETTRENLPAAMRLVAEILREPSFPADEFEQLKVETLAGIDQQRSEPSALGSNAYARYMSPYAKGDPRYVMTPDEQVEAVKAVTLDDVKRFYRDFYGASNGELAVVGSFDAKGVEALAGELFGGWKSPAPYARLVGVYKAPPAAVQAIEAPDKANAFFLAGVPLEIRDDDPDYPALVLGNYMLGGGFLNSRLATRIRQKEGISYGVGSQLSASPEDKVGAFMTYAIYAPENASRLEAAFREEIARALKEGFTADEVAAAKSGWLQSRQVGRSDDGSLAGSLVGKLYLGRTFAWDADFERKVAALTPDQIADAMRRRIDPSKITIVRAGDFAKSAGAKPAPNPAVP